MAIVEKHTVMCAILGYKGVFSVEIKSDEDVSALKNKIQQAKHALAPLDADHLTLFKVNIPVPDTQTYHSVADLILLRAIPFNRGDELQDPFCELSMTRDGFPKRNIHILVEVPAGESFSARPGRDVAEIVLLLTTPTLQRLADHLLPPHLSLADRLSLFNHFLIVQHRPRCRPYVSWSSNDSRLHFLATPPVVHVIDVF